MSVLQSWCGLRTRWVENQHPRKIVANVTDAESRVMKTKDGWIQDYNVQAAVNGEQVVVASAATKDHNDVNQLEPMIEATRAAADAAGISGPIGLVLADAGYWSEENATADGPDRLIATTKGSPSVGQLVSSARRPVLRRLT